MNLTDEQRSIVDLFEGVHLVLAPPGTGKTELLSHRADSALNKGVLAEDMICLTFTNRAAKSMKERVEEKHSSHNIFIGNIHNFCSTFLFKNRLVPQFTSLLDEEDSNLLLEEAITSENYPRTVKGPELLKFNTFIKQRNLGFPENILLPPDKIYPYNSHEAKVVATYEDLKTESSFLDFDDLLTLSYRYLSDFSNSYELTKYSWIQVDEVQDINPIEWEIIRLISEQNAHVVYFGDYEQAIFSFLGVRLERLHAMENVCKVHNLQKNFRSPSYLLNIFIDFAKAHLTPSWKKDPFPNSYTPPEPDSLLMYNINGTVTAEVLCIAKDLLPAYNAELGKQTAILVRTNKTAATFSNILTAHNIEHFSISGYDLFNRALIKDIIAFLNCMATSYDRISWVRLFCIFANIPTLKESRHFVNALYENGFLPTDFLSSVQPLKSLFKAFIRICKNGRVVIFDTETTGLNTELDDIIQIAAIELINGVPGKTFEIYFKTDKSLAQSEHVHHITNDFLEKNGFPAKEALSRFRDFVNKDTLIAHNLDYDWNILHFNNLRNGIDTVSNYSSINFDTLQITRRLFPKLTSYKLENLISEFKILGVNSHNALDDVKATANLVEYLIPIIESRIPVQHSFYHSNGKLIGKFSRNLAVFWSDYELEVTEETTFRSVINDFLNHSKTTVNYDFDLDLKPQLEKLLRHMDVKCGTKPLKTLLQKHVPEYRAYKESDLITEKEKTIISTIHKAKGLEFENVIIPECIQSVYPNYYSRTEEQQKEDARTLYVALTRAKKRLIITSHTMFISPSGGRYSRTTSPFLDSIAKHFKKISI